MKLGMLIGILMVAFLANSAIAVYWDPDIARAPLIGNWSNAENWKGDGTKPPNGDSPVDVYGVPGCAKPVATVNSDCSFSVWHSNRTRFFGGATVQIVPGGTLAGIGWIRIGEGSIPNGA